MRHMNRRALCAFIGLAASMPALSAPALEEIIVTAQRQAQTLQNVGIPVSALSAEAIRDAAIGNPTDLTTMVPALIVQPAAGPSTQLYMRGVGTFSANAFAENAIAFSVDGIYSANIGAAISSFYDLERIEVLKGPQGTLYGRNATGGAINLITKKPELAGISGYLTLEAGNYDLKRAEGAINVPLSDRVAARLAGYTIDRDGYLSDGYDDADNTAARLQVLFQTDNWSTTLQMDHFDQGGKGLGAAKYPRVGDPWTGAADPRSLARVSPPDFPFDQSRASYAETDGFNDSQFWGASAIIEGDLGWGELTIIPAYRKADIDFRSYAPGFMIETADKSEQQSLEIRLATELSDRIELVSGAYYFNDEVETLMRIFSGMSDSLDDATLETTSYAVFSQGTFNVTEDFRVILGARYTDEEKTQDTNFSQSMWFEEFIVPGGLSFSQFHVKEKESYEKVTWKAGVEFNLSPDVLLYANVATGFKAGGFFVEASNNSFDAEEITAYTIGAKSRFLNQRLQINAELFFWDYQDQQISHLGPIEVGGGEWGAAFVTDNVGQADIQGIEVEFQALVTDNGFLSGSVQYLDNTYKEFEYRYWGSPFESPAVGCGGTLDQVVNDGFEAIWTVDCAGKPGVASPDWTVNLQYEHTFDLGAAGELRLGARARYESGRYLSVEYTENAVVEEYAKFDAYAAYQSQDGAWEVTAFINNIENKAIYSSTIARPYYTGDAYNGLLPPRTYGARVTYNF